jgi:hypothetical protein
MSRAKRMTSRVQIDEATVEEALYLASIAKDSKMVHDFADKEKRYLVLRQRGSRVGWFVRAKRRMKRIGNAKKEPGDPDFLGLRKVRQKAGEQYYTMKPGNAAKRSLGWTWADLDREFQASRRVARRVGRRIKKPVRSTQKDIGGCFNKPQFAAWRSKRLSDLTDVDLITLMGEIHAAPGRGHGACSKTLAWVKAALSWARSERTIESGLVGTMPWWTSIKPPQPNEVEIKRMEVRQQDLVAAKEAFTVEHLGDLLARHERYCAGRAGNEKISPAVRGGLWWLALTINRKFTCSQTRRCNLQYVDPLNPYSSPDHPWGKAEWPADAVKNKRAFMLPIPPIGVHIARCCKWDWELLVGKKRGLRSGTEWLFASTRRQSRRGHPDNPDVGLYPSSLNAHLRAMRGDKKSGKKTTNYLDELPPFWPHLVRSVATNFLAAHIDKIPPAAASVMLGHVLPIDRTVEHGEMSDTTKEHYLTAQHMPLKAQAMKSWADAILRAYVKAGGTLPMPHEQDPRKPDGPDWLLPKLPSVAGSGCRRPRVRQTPAVH